jgi:protein SCO1/2
MIPGDDALAESPSTDPLAARTGGRVLRVIGYALLAMCFFAAGFLLLPLLDNGNAPGGDRGVDLERVELPRPVPIGEFALTDIDGNVNSGAYTRDRLLNQWTLMYFGYTHCPDVCSPTLALLAEVARGLRATPQWTARLASTRLELVFVTVDPSRDTPAALRSFLATTETDIVALRGDEKQIAGLAQQMGIMHLRGPADARGRYLVDHPATILFVDPRAHLRAGFSMPRDAARIVELMSEIADRFDARRGG